MSPERHAHADRAAVVAMAVASDINDELTIILSALEMLEPEDSDAGLELIEARHAAVRIAWKVSGLLHYAARRGVRPVNATAERLMLEDACR